MDALTYLFGFVAHPVMLGLIVKKMSEASPRTRNRIIASLRAGEKTVNELQAEMELTDNAIRQQLESLEREGLVTVVGTRAGTRKPHNLYRLTPLAQKKLFEGCEPLLGELLAALSACIEDEKVREVLIETGRRMAQQIQPDSSLRLTKEAKIEKALDFLRKLGGSPRLERQNDNTLMIRSLACPWAPVASNHPEVCVIAEQLLSQVIGEEVRELCDRSSTPKCSFAVLSAWA